MIHLVKETKICSACGEEKPASPAFFHVHEDGRLRSKCKPCRNASKRVPEEFLKRQRAMAHPLAEHPLLEDVIAFQEMGIPMAACSGCRAQLPIDPQFFNMNSDGTPHGYCRRCSMKYAREYRERKEAGLPTLTSIRSEAKRKAVLGAGKKPCSRCGVEQPLAQFTPSKYAVDGRHSNCRACARELKLVSLAKLPWDERLAMNARHKHRAHWEGSESDISAEYLRALHLAQEGRCYWFGIPLELGRGDLRQVSLDRLDTDHGYLQGNVVLTCLSANLARSDSTPEAFATFINDLRTALVSK